LQGIFVQRKQATVRALFHKTHAPHDADTMGEFKYAGNLEGHGRATFLQCRPAEHSEFRIKTVIAV